MHEGVRMVDGDGFKWLFGIGIVLSSYLEIVDYCLFSADRFMGLLVNAGAVVVVKFGSLIHVAGVECMHNFLQLVDDFRRLRAA